MPCCGQKRNALKTNTSPSPVSPVNHYLPAARLPAPAQSAAPARATYAYAVMVEYTQNTPIVVEGVASRRRYEFSTARRLQLVDAGDAEAMLRTQFFVRR